MHRLGVCFVANVRYGCYPPGRSQLCSRAGWLDRRGCWSVSGCGSGLCGKILHLISDGVSFVFYGVGSCCCRVKRVCPVRSEERVSI